MKSIILTLLYACIQIPAVEAGAASFLPNNFKSWIWQSTIVVDNWLYIDGGEIYAGADTSAGVPNNNTYAIDLSKSWHTSSVAASVSPRNSDFGTVRRPQLYYDESHHTVYSSSGYFYDFDQNTVEPSVWGFTPAVDGSVKWTDKFSKKLDSSFPLISSNWDALTASSGSNHYALGGVIIFNTEPDNPDAIVFQQMAMEQFVTYDYKTQTFKNQTHSQHAYGGEAQFVPQYGEEGVVLFFGGIQLPDKSFQLDNQAANLSMIQVYDIHTGAFYNQTATNAPIGSFIFGGSTGKSTSQSNGTPLSTVYILTLPYFHWLEVPNPVAHFRAGHSCALIGPKAIPNRNQRQMVSVGGDYKAGHTDYTFDDEWNNGMKIFDLHDLSWSDDYDAAAKPYVRSDAVNKYYADNPSYTVKWDNKALSSIFDNGVSPVISAATTAATGDAGNAGGTKKSNTGAIAGGVVGGIVALAIAGALVFFWRRRRAYHGIGPETPPSKDSDGLYMPELGGPMRGELLGDSTRREEMPAGTVRRELPAVDAPVEIYTNERHELPAADVYRSAKE
ncbi:hypothetical protein V495_02105 [Pseudogymnoascus sp. VKM F-4514 (FW-929)]|nr:hypothetical protein V495_02105 [Pseudogymnoascus sp. VKM F-4514 (FW-929)]